MPTRHLNYWMSHLPECTYANLFGPTETTDICTFYVVDRSFDDSEILPIGKACDNCDVFLLTEDGRMANPGNSGRETEAYRSGSSIDDTPYGNSEMRKRRKLDELAKQQYMEERASARQGIAKQGRKNRDDADDGPEMDGKQSGKGGSGGRKGRKNGRGLKIALVVLLILVIGVGGVIAAADNEHDCEAIIVKMDGLGRVGYVANSPFTVLGESISAGRLYDKIGEKAEAVIVYVLPKGVICRVDTAV